VIRGRRGILALNDNRVKREIRAIKVTRENKALKDLLAFRERKATGETKVIRGILVPPAKRATKESRAFKVSRDFPERLETKAIEVTKVKKGIRAIQGRAYRQVEQVVRYCLNEPMMTMTPNG
jgi:hypothetical protein